MGETRMDLPGWSSKVAVMTTTIMAVIASSTWAVEAGRDIQSSDFVSASSTRLSCGGAAAAPLFVFGASYMDVGENFAAMPFRSISDYLPYGVDFSASATGRHSNGRLIIDHISEGLGQELLSPYLRDAGTIFQHGVSFASSGSKACNSSVEGDGSSSSGLFSLSVQVDQFRVFRQQALSMYKSKKKDAQRLFSTPRAFSKGVYIIEIGNNDYHDVRVDEVDAMIPLILQSIELGVKALYNEGARTIVIMDAYPVACFPYLLISADLDQLNEDGCVIPFTKIEEQHNVGLKVMVANLNAELVEGKLVLFSLYDVFMSAIRNPSKFGLKYVHKACCGYGGGDYNFNKVVNCGQDGILDGELQKATVCENRSEYMMWDHVHPTDAFSFHIAQAFLRGENMQPSFHIKEMCRHKQ